MKKLTNLNEVLAFQLEGMYDGEKKLQHQLPIFCERVQHCKLDEEITKYAERSVEKRSKLKRVFSYLLVPPSKRKNNVIDSLLTETAEILNNACTDNVKDAVVTSCIQSINHYNIANYSTALAFAIELDLDAVADLLHEILEWEKESELALQKIAFEELRKKEPTSAIKKV